MLHTRYICKRMSAELGDMILVALVEAAGRNNLRMCDGQDRVQEVKGVINGNVNCYSLGASDRKQKSRQT